MKPHRLPWWVSVPLAIVGGTLLDVATPSVSWWPAGVLGATVIIAALWQQRWFVGALIGAVAGAAFWGTQISWLTLYLGPIPWLALCAVMVFWWVLCGAAIAGVTRELGKLRGRFPVWAVSVMQSLSVAGLWVIREQVQSTWPYGGFAWGRLAHTIADAPGVGLVSWLGFAGVSGLLAACAAGCVAALWAWDRPSFRGTLVAVAGASVVVIALATLIPPAPLETVGELRVAAVQGNSKSAIFDDRESGDVLRDHIEGTEALLDSLEQAGERVDVIVWPENSAEFEIPRQFFSAQRIERLAVRAGAPIVIGSIMPNDGGTYSNSTLVYDADGLVDLRYDKRRPVPFAEYMPNREFFRSLVPDLVDLVQLEYAHGTRPTVLPLETAAGMIQAGIAICFDIIFDDQAVALSNDGAQVVFAQTNNADFGDTDQSAQQLQIAKLRAVELGRSVVNISTVATSAVVSPDGSLLAEIEPFTAEYLVATVPLVEGTTPALKYGAVWAGLWIAFGALGVVAAVTISLRGRAAPTDHKSDD